MSACKTPPSACFLPHLIVCFAAGIGAVVSELALQDKALVKPIERVHFPDSPRIARQASESCDVNVNEEEGWLFSPNYPSNYANQQSCSFVIQRWRRDVCQVQLTLMDFDLDDTNGCFGDYLDISDGSPSVPGGGKLCGSLATGTKKTLTFPRGRDSMTLRFQSDARSTRKGFMIKVNQRLDSCDKRPDPFDNEAVCDQQLTGYEAVLRSPGYPNWYPRETRCRYTLRRPDSTVCRVELNFVRFEVEYSPGCRNDFLELPGGNRLCGNVVAPSIVEYPTGSSSMNILFSSDLRGTGPGFEVVIRQVPNSCGRIPPRPIPPGPNGDCDRLLRGPSDRVVLRSRSSDWSRPRRCRFLVRQFDRSVCRVVMVLERFELDPRDRDCNWEYLQLPDGTRLCGTLSGRKTLTFPRGENSLALEYVNDRGRSSRSQGLQLFLDQVSGSCGHSTDDFCDQELSGYESRATSPDFPAEYGPNKRCRYYLRRADPTVCLVDVDFYFFDLERGRDLNCQQDYLELPDGTKLCGIVAGQRVYKFPSGSGTFQLVFNSDHYGKGKGFDIRIRQRPNSCDSPRPDCGTTYEEEIFDLTSPGFRNGSYPSNEDCRYLVRKKHNDVCALQVKYNAFDLQQSPDCDRDFLEISDQKICGKLPLDTTRTYEFPEDTLTIRFRSDNRQTGAGFFLTIKQVQC